MTPGQNYQYKVGTEKGKWSAVADFKTEPEGKRGFSFVWFGDTHYSKIWGDMIQKVNARHSDVSFYSIGNDRIV